MANYLIVVITTLTLFPGISSHALAQVDGGRMLNETIYGAVSGLFSEAERQLISDYFQDTNRLEDEDNRDKKHKKATRAPGCRKSSSTRRRKAASG